MNFFSVFFSFIFGTLIGSFINVVIFRYNTGMTLMGRSKCFSCGNSLSWYELIPVFSFLIQNGACRNCKSKISWQYPTVEIVSGVLFALIFYFFPPLGIAEGVHTLFYIFITAILVVITVYDIKHKIIPDSFAYAFAILAFIHMFVGPELNFVMPKIYDLFSGIIIALPFAIIWFASKGKWMGLGDAKLMVGIGYTLGLFQAISSLILAFWIGAFVSILWMIVVVKKMERGYEIPFGPFLILSMYIVLFTGITVIDIPLLLSL